MAKLSDSIDSDIKNYLLDNHLSNKDSVEYDLDEMDPKDKFDAWLRYNGIIGFTDKILAVFDQIYVRDALNNLQISVESHIYKACSLTSDCFNDLRDSLGISTTDDEGDDIG